MEATTDDVVHAEAKRLAVLAVVVAVVAHLAFEGGGWLIALVIAAGLAACVPWVFSDRGAWEDRLRRGLVEESDGTWSYFPVPYSPEGQVIDSSETLNALRAVERTRAWVSKSVFLVALVSLVLSGVPAALGVLGVFFVAWRRARSWASDLLGRLAPATNPLDDAEWDERVVARGGGIFALVGLLAALLMVVSIFRLAIMPGSPPAVFVWLFVWATLLAWAALDRFPIHIRIWRRRWAARRGATPRAAG